MTRLLIPLLDQRPPALVGDGPRPPADNGLAVQGGSLTGWVRAVGSSADAALVVDPRGAVVAASAAAAELLGRAVADLLGRDLSQVGGFVDFHVDSRPIDGGGRSSLAPIQALRHDSLARSLLRVRTPEGELITCDCIAAPLHDTTRRVIGVLTLLRRVGCTGGAR